MKRKVSSFSCLVAFVCLSLIGLALVFELPVKLAPSQTLPNLTVSFSMPGNSPEVVESEVTGKLESLMARIRGVHKIVSTSSNGSGSIDVELDRYANVDAVRFEISTLIRQVWSELPDGVTYPVIEAEKADENAARPFLNYTLNAPATPIEIEQYAERQIKPALSMMKGVYKVELSGATPMEWRLKYDSSQLENLGIGLDEVEDEIRRSLEREFLGMGIVKDSGSGESWIRLMMTASETTDRPDLQNMYVKSKSGSLVSLDKLLSAVRTEQDPTGYFRINGLNSVYLSITAEKSANQLRLSKEIKKRLNQLEQTMPAGYEVHLMYDATDYIGKELNKIYYRTGLTVLILLLLVVAVTRDRRYLWLVVSSLAVNLLVAVIFYYLFGLEMQLYSLAGITISLNLVIDNTIVMADHLMHRKNLRAFPATLAATLTTIGALVIIFFLDDRLRLNLQDFAAVVIINLLVSLAVALFFVPAMMERTGMEEKSSGKMRFPRLAHYLQRGKVHVIHFYSWLVRQLVRFRWAVCIAFVLLFGLPVFMLPEHVEGEGRWASLYNDTFGSDTYKEDYKPVVDKFLGGTLRLFVNEVFNGSYFERNDETVLSINANLPNGSTLEQMDQLIRQMEQFLSGYKQIRQFQTSVYNANRAAIQVYFTKEASRSGFPYTLKADVVSKALQLGGGSWGVYGLPDNGFNNDVRESAGSFRIKMYGYNYDDLREWADSLKARLLEHRRIKEVTVNSEFSWWKDDYQEFVLNLNKEKLAEANVSTLSLYHSLQPVFGRNMTAGAVSTSEGSEYIKMTSRQSSDRDVWGLQNIPFKVDSTLYKLSDFATVTKENASPNIVKENQQYRLCLQYEYIGAYEQGKKILTKDLESFAKVLPIGYSAQSDDDRYSWNEKEKGQYWLLGIVIIIIFFTTAVLFNSLKQPFAILCVIPTAFIGIFLTFYLFDLNFDQGGFAAMVLLCGITVNACIYILNEYNSIRKNKRTPDTWAYMKAFNRKINPIFLTISSTVLGFVPFLIGTDKEAFWFPLAAGTIGGLLMSVAGIFLLLPVFTLKKEGKSSSFSLLQIKNLKKHT